jgi:chromate transporter
MDNKPSFKEALRFWWKLGWISFGGPAGQIAIMHRFLVEEKKWVNNEKFMHALNFCMLLPGPEAMQLASYIGWLMHGRLGAIVAGVLFILPSMLILTILSALYVVFGKILWVQGLFDGLKPAVLAIVLVALLKIGKKALHTKLHYAVAILAFLALTVFHLPFPLVVGTALILGFFVFKKNDTAISQRVVTSPRYRSHLWSSLRVVVVAVTIGIIPLVAINLFHPEQAAFWNTIGAFFTKAALVTFGGAYAVLPFVAQTAVEQYHWLSAPQMVDGLALGETTPGPLIMVLAFVGYMAAYHQYEMIWWMGIPGLVMTTLYTFLPSFVFILAGAPWVERTAQNARLKSALEMVTAAVVGVLLNLCFYLGKSILFVGGVSLSGVQWLYVAWTILSVVVLRSGRIGMITWIVISALFGISTALVRQFIL